MSHRWLCRSLLATLTVAALIALPATTAGAAPPVLERGFTPPAIPAGGETFMRFRCIGDDSGVATVDLDGPGASDFTDLTVSLSPDNGDGLGSFWLGGAASLGGMDTSELGSYTFTVECPSGGGTSDFAVDVLAPSVPFVASGFGAVGSVDTDDCARGGAAIEVALGASSFLCYEFTNPLGDVASPDGAVSLAYVQPGVGSGATLVRPGQDGDPPLPAGGEYTALAGPGPVVHEDTEFELYLTVDDGAGNYAVSEILPVTMTSVSPLEVTVTSGLTTTSSCPSEGGAVDRTVPLGTDVYFCYTVRSVSNASVQDHTTVSDLQGVIASGLASTVQGPEETLQLPVGVPVAVDRELVNAVTWDATYTSFAGDIPVSATGAAVVQVGDPVESEPVDPPPRGALPTSSPAQPTVAQPDLAG